MSLGAARIRSAFSLLEVIIATAILAGSALVLFSLIGLGTKYGNRAEERTLAFSQAQSIMDEFAARLDEGEISNDLTGVLPGTPARGFRVEMSPYEIAPQRRSPAGSPSSDTKAGSLYRIRVSLYVSERAGEANASGADSQTLCQLVRLVRKPITEAMETNAARGGSSR